MTTPIAQGPVDVNVRGWMPIETAPKDGTWVLAVNSAISQTRLHIVRYSEHDGTRFHWVRGSAPMDFVDGLTYWMPLPKTPNAEVRGATSTAGLGTDLQGKNDA